MDKDDIQKIVQAAVVSACKVCLQEVDSRIQEAIKIGAELGATIGAEAGAKAAVRAAERERKRVQQQQYDNRLHNTRLLLRHYRSLNQHYKHAVYSVTTATQESDEFAEIMSIMMGSAVDEEVYIESIKQSMLRTKVIMTHVNKMLDIYKRLCLSGGRQDDARHWRVLEAMYLADEKTPVTDIAIAEAIDKRTVYKDLDICVSDLTTLFFGVEGIRK